jgi:hypothetical protein
MRKSWLFAFALPCLLCFATATAAAQNVSSDKAFFSYSADDVTVSSMDTPFTILTGQIKTSNVGSILAGVSLECALWTDNVVTATSNTGTNTTSSRATITVTVYVDGVASPQKQVVFCDRLQQTSLSVLTTGTAVDTITLELFQATKNADHFNFYAPNNQGSAFVHNVVVQATGTLSCTSNGTSVPCAPGAAGDTKAVVGKRTLVLENFNNTNL